MFIYGVVKRIHIMISRIYDTIIVGIVGAIIAIIGNTDIFKNSSELKYIFIASVSVMIYILAVFIRKNVYYKYIFRFGDPRAAYIGPWVEYFNNGEHDCVGVINIFVNMNTGTFEIAGFTHNAISGEYEYKWISHAVEFSLKEQEIRYMYSKSTKSDGEVRGYGVGHMYFKDAPNGSIEGTHGRFTDEVASHRKGDMIYNKSNRTTLERVDKEILNKYNINFDRNHKISKMHDYFVPDEIFIKKYYSKVHQKN